MLEAALRFSVFFLTVCALLCPQVSDAANQPVILIMGDSLSAAYRIPQKDGWVQLLRSKLKRQGYDLRVINASIPGETTAGGVARLPALISRYHPAVVLIELGGNDGLRGLSLTAMQSNLEKMVTLSRRAGARVLLVGVRLPPNYGRMFVQRFVHVFHVVARKQHVALVPKILAHVGSNRQLMQPNGVHPLAKAEPKVLENVWVGLHPLLGGLTSGS